MLKISDLTFEYIRKRPVFDGLSLDLESGGRLSLYGSVGAGKSTLCRIISGYERKYGGSVTVDGVEMKNADKRDLNLLFVGDDYMLVSRKTVLENASFGLKLRKYPKEEAERLSMESLRLVGLSEKAFEKAKTLDRAEQFLLSLARGLARSPSLVILDDVFFGSEDEEELYKRVIPIISSVDSTLLFSSSSVFALQELDFDTAVLNFGKIGYFGKFSASPYVE